MQTPFKGYCLATGCKNTKHTRSGSSKRVCCFLLQLDQFFPFHRHTFIISLFICVCVHSINCVNAYTLGSGYNSVLEQQTQDQKVLGLSPGRSGGRIVFSRVNFLCQQLILVSVPLCVTAVLCKRSWSFWAFLEADNRSRFNRAVRMPFMSS